MTSVQLVVAISSVKVIEAVVNRLPPNAAAASRSPAEDDHGMRIGSRRSCRELPGHVAPLHVGSYFYGCAEASHDAGELAARAFDLFARRRFRARLPPGEHARFGDDVEDLERGVQCAGQPACGRRRLYRRGREVHSGDDRTAAAQIVGVRLRRAFGFGETGSFDPFLLLDDFRNDRPADYRAGFPWHPHRGIETITYVLAGTVDHGDSLGNQGSLGAGDVQWMTAGRGIVHQEMPTGDEQGRMHGFQLWANLPSALKMTAPR